MCSDKLGQKIVKYQFINYVQFVAINLLITASSTTNELDIKKLYFGEMWKLEFAST